MRRAATRVVRTSYQCTARGLGRARSRSVSHPNAFHSHQAVRFQSSGLQRPRPRARPAAAAGGARPDHALGEPLRSSMYIRRFSVAIVSGLVGYGAWQFYKTNGTTGDRTPWKAYSTGRDDGGPAPRPVLVIGADELHTGTFVGEGPISKTTDEGRRVLEMLTPEQASQKLRKSEESYFVNRGQGVVRYDLVQLPSNDPIEDDHAEKIVELPSKGSVGDTSDWMFWGVFDGHSGWTTSAKLRQTLISFVARELDETYKAAKGMSPSQEAVDAAIKTGFTRLDDEIVHQSVQKVLKSNNKIIAAELLAPALSGSCALLSFYDTKAKKLSVACTGTPERCLAVGPVQESGRPPRLVRPDRSNPDEVARMRKLHPGEDYVIRNGRVLGGLEPTRAFGDASYKWTKEISARLRESFFGRTESPLLKTPPYVTAEPVVTTTKIEPENGDFVVMATDGLWEMLTNEEVVGLVGKWIEAHGGGGGKDSSRLASLWPGKSSGLPVENGGAGGSGSDGGQKTPIRLQQWGISAEDKNRFVVKDKNAATHLIRNALGGNNEEQVSALLTLPSPFSRRYRDDLTVQVIFFGQGEKSGEVVMNEEASAPAEKTLKAKL